MKSTSGQLVLHYRQVLDDHMRGLPFVNAALDVEAIGFRVFGDHSLGVLITPWFMNLVLLPGTDEWSDDEQGSIRAVPLPAETIDFNVCRDDELGTYLTAVLFRTVSDFPDQETVRDTATEIMRRLFERPAQSRPGEAPRFSRRELFRRLGTG